MSSPVTEHRPSVNIEIRYSDKSASAKRPLRTINISGMLGDFCQVMTQKDLLAPAGEFSIQLYDVPHSEMIISGTTASGNVVTPPPSLLWRDSIYGFVEPLDVVEIRMARDKVPKELMPVVMRGFVRSVGRDEIVAQDGRPRRTVSIMGHDFGCLFSLQQIGIMQEMMKGNIVNPLWPMLSAVGQTPVPTSSSAFMGHMADLTNPLMRGTGFTLERDLTVTDGDVYPTSITTLEGPLWELMTRFSDTPWNELFVRENPSNPVLVYRPTPWVGLDNRTFDEVPTDNHPAPPPDTDIHDIYQREVVTLRSHRDDSGVANFVLVQNSSMMTWQHTFQIVAPYSRGKRTQHPQSDPDKYGYRLLSVEAHQGPPNVPPGNLPEAEQKKAQMDWAIWLDKRIAKLLWSTESEVNFEKGTIVVHGRPKIKVGDYVRMHRGKMVWSAYVNRVVHEFQPMNSYLTTLSFVRGTQYIVRSGYQGLGSPYDAERAPDVTI